ncbi:MAG: peptidoglycan-binding protein [Clostridia bacterium]|nr:peptidoglycan-binding protein [Clostridia bacterium]
MKTLQPLLDGVKKYTARFMEWFRSLPKRMQFIGMGAAGVILLALILLIVWPRQKQEELSVSGDAISLKDPKESAFAMDGGDDEPVVVDIVPTPSPTPEPTPVPTPTPVLILKKGMESEEVQELQERLMRLGYLDIDESTQYFGPATEDAVRRFQRQHDLAQDGEAGPITLELIYSDEAKKYTLLEGMEGTDIDSFQRVLKELGYLNKVTGYYGTETIQAVKDFQSRNGLGVDGKAGEQTFDLIYSPNAKPSATKAKEERRKANISTMIDVAKKQLGDKYILGDEGPNSFDCSGLVYYCLREAGSNRRRYNAAGYSQVSDWEKITSMSDLEKGDLIFFYNDAKTKVGHVGIYIGGGTMIDASSSNGKVVRRSCTTSYWRNHFVCGRRPW